MLCSALPIAQEPRMQVSSTRQRCSRRLSKARTKDEPRQVHKEEDDDGHNDKDCLACCAHESGAAILKKFSLLLDSFCPGRLLLEHSELFTLQFKRFELALELQLLIRSDFFEQHKKSG